MHLTMGMNRMLDERRRETREQRDVRLRRHAQEALKAHGLSSAPIPLLRFGDDHDDLRIYAKDLRGSCDGLLRWHQRSRRFYLYYDPNPFRQRFNLAHELAHYLIDEHHHAIRTGASSHMSNKQGLITFPRMETEANLVATELLIPMFLFRHIETEPCIGDVQRIATEFDVSQQVAARRIVEHTNIPSALIVSRAGRIAWGIVNDALYGHGAWGIISDSGIPTPSATDAAARSGAHQTGSTHAGLWFENTRYPMRMREEAIASPGHRTVITLLSEA